MVGCRTCPNVALGHFGDTADVVRPLLTSCVGKPGGRCPSSAPHTGHHQEVDDRPGGADDRGPSGPDSVRVVPAARLHTAARVAGWVALVLALLPFGLFLATKFMHAFRYPYVVPLYAVLVALVVAVNRCVARGLAAAAAAFTAVAVVGAVLLFGFYSWPAVAILVVEVVLAAAAGRADHLVAPAPI